MGILLRINNSSRCASWLLVHTREPPQRDSEPTSRTRTATHRVRWAHMRRIQQNAQRAGFHHDHGIETDQILLHRANLLHSKHHERHSLRIRLPANRRHQSDIPILRLRRKASSTSTEQLDHRVATDSSSSDVRLVSRIPPLTAGLLHPSRRQVNRILRRRSRPRRIPLVAILDHPSLRKTPRPYIPLPQQS
jgi:hypothetical protein